MAFALCRRLLLSAPLFALHLISVAQWNPDKAVNNPVVANQGNQYFSVSCSDGQGGTITAWYDNRGIINNPLHNVYVQRLNHLGQQQWASSGVSMGVLTAGFGDMDIVSDGSGGAVLAFISGSGTSLQIQAQLIDATGAKKWNGGNPVIVCDAPNEQLNPRLASVGTGFVIVWQDRRSGTNYDIYAQMYDKAGSALWSLNGVVVNAAVNDQILPEVTPIGMNESIITWDDFRNGSNADIYAQRLSANGVRYWRGTDNLLSGRAISTAATNQRFPLICSDGFTGAIIAWQDFRNGGTNSTDIYAQRIDSSGSVKWTTNGVAISATTSVQNIQDMVYTKDGAAVCWANFPIGGDFNTYDIYAQKVDSLGAVQWGAQGVAVCNAPELQNTPKMAPDNAGGAFLTWIDKRAGLVFPNSIYAQRILSTGVAAWAENGVVVCNNINTGRTNPHLVNHGCDVTIVWDDARSSCCGITDNDIYATKLNCEGSVSILAFNGFTWAGTVSNAWNNAANWSGNAVPEANSDVLIPGGTPFSPLIAAGSTVVVRSLRLQPGAVLQVGTGASVLVQ